MTPENFKPAGKSNAFVQPVVLCLLLVLATLAVYWPAVRCDFVNFDDPDYFFSNPHVLAGLSWSNFHWAFTTSQTCNWHPLTWLSLMLDAELFGPGPAGPHFTNLLFHLANTALLFLLLRRLTGAMWRSALVAALFALHPLHVESVAWISERKDVLSTCFGLLALWFYAGYAQGSRGESREPRAGSGILALDPRRRTLDYFLALFFFAFSLLSKPMWVTLPFLLLLLDGWPLQRFIVPGLGFRIQNLVWEKIPFFLLAAASCVVTFLVQQKGGAVVTLGRIPLSGRLENTVVAYARYLGKTVWPMALGNPYPHPGRWAGGVVILSALLIIGLSVAAVGLGRKRPFVPVGWFWFLGTLIPVIGLVQVGGQSMADRYTYLPLIGLFVIFAWGGWGLWLQRGWPGPLAALVAGLLLAACALQTWLQISYWQNTETLFKHALAVTENNIVACNKLGSFYARQGRMAEAMNYYVKALQINPNDPDVLYDQGNAFARQGDWDNAIASYQHALQVAPGQADILNNLGFALAARKRFAEAISCFEGALKLNPDSADTHNNLATVYFMQKNLDDAVRHFREAVRLDPGNSRFHSNLGDALAKSGQTAEAITCYQETLRLKPDDLQVKAKLKALGVPVSD